MTNHITQKHFSFHLIPCVIENCLVLLRNFADKPVE